MGCPCSCTYTVTFVDGTEETFTQFTHGLERIKERGFSLGDRQNTFRRNTEECACRCANCTSNGEKTNA